MDNGWVKIFRKLDEWGWYQDSKTLHLFIHLLLHANHKAINWQDITVERGQLVVGLLALKKATGISIQSIRTSLVRLESTGEITRKSTNKYTIVTLCNYSEYQTDQRADQQTINKQLTNNQQTTNNKQEVKNIRIKEDKDKDLKTNTLDVSEKPTRRKASQNITDEDFINALKINVAYQGIDFNRELGKMDAWLLMPQNKARKKTHKFILGWLGRAERTVTTGGKNGISRPNTQAHNAGRRQDNSRFANVGETFPEPPTDSGSNPAGGVPGGSTPNADS